MSYIGNPIVSTDFPVDYASGNGSTTAFTLSIAPASVNSIDVQISGVSQSPQTYSVSGTTLTFSAAPPTGTNNIVVRHLGIAGIPNTPSAGSVAYSSLNSSLQGTVVGRNRIINGAMVIDQRNAGASVTPSSSGTYTLDRWATYFTQASKFSVQQNAGSVTPPAGFTNYLGVTSTSAYSVGASDEFDLVQPIEGFNVADLDFGKSTAKTITVSAWVRSSLTGTFGGSVYNSAVDWCYPFSFSIPVANTWTQISVTIAGQTSGTWLTTNGTGMNLLFSLGAGSSRTGTANTWVNANRVGVTGQVNVVGTSGATFYITGVQLEVGASATNFEVRSYGTELALCQRYYEQTFIYVDGGLSAASSRGGFAFFKVTKRDTPSTVTFSGGVNTPLLAGLTNALGVGVYNNNSNYFYSGVIASSEL